MKKMYLALTAMILALTSLTASAQPQSRAEHPVELNPLWSNWYVQAGMDLSLQNPYGHDFSGVFPNGKSFGVDLAVGRWFTPELGLRGKLNWENGIPLLENKHANWLAPFYEPGVNMDKGGYICLTGDIQLDLHNIFLGYDAERRWNLQVYPRAGIAYCFGVSKGTPLLGAGLGNTFRINDRFKVYLDMAYSMVSSGFVGVEKSTGTGSNNNGFMDLNAGVQYNFGPRRTFIKPAADRQSRDGQIVTGRIWQNWFVQAGLDMSLMNPYGYDFSKVFPKGKTFGLAGAVGKWFSPEVALRARCKWENGCKLFKNDHLEWMATANDGKSNMDHGGYVEGSLDVELSLSNMIGGYDEGRMWNVIVFPRAGLISNLATQSASPLVGAGAGTTYRLTDQWSLYGDVAYQMTTSEFFFESSGTGMSVSTGSNGFFDIHFGVQYDLGKKRSDRFRRSAEL